MLDNLEYKILHKATPEIKELLSATIYGTTGLRYSHLDTDEKLDRITNPDFHTLWLQDKLIAVAAYCKRMVTSEQKRYPAYYIRYFSVQPSHQGQGIGKLLTEKLEQHYRAKTTEPTLFYAYIEKKNLRSIAVSNQFKSESIGAFKSVLFSRFKPNVNSRFTAISPIEFETFASQHYSDHALFLTDKLGYKNQCYGIRENGHLVAAVQANPVSWKVHHIPGFLGWLSRNVLHFIPILGRLAPRSTFSFVAFEGLRTRSGHEDKIIPLMASCLAKHKMYVGMSYFDVKDPIFTYMSELNGMGLMRIIQHPPAVSVLCYFLNFPEEEKQPFFDNPKYLSCFDLT
ncbi:MAG: GNAT family N-acetyltransferase [Flavobacteriales bacterium]|nr:GNAT family N-acetyltransferase [Flavobacteriales bacterium]